MIHKCDIRTDGRTDRRTGDSICALYAIAHICYRPSAVARKNEYGYNPFFSFSKWPPFFHTATIFPSVLRQKSAFQHVQKFLGKKGLTELIHKV